MNSQVQKCRRCDLYKNATQGVLGEGDLNAQIFIVGEQPGDQEDLEGHPFVGPSGRLLDQILQQAEIDRAQVFITNAVKHFKWRRAGKRRLHQKPNAAQIEACELWLQAEVEMVKPSVIGCLGATAVRAVFGKAQTIGPLRGKPLTSKFAGTTFVTIHPSAILRLRDREARLQATQQMIKEFKLIKTYLSSN